MPGGGRPKGSKNKTTIDRLRAEQDMKDRILKHLNPLLEAQMSIAKGATFLYRIEEVQEGKITRKKHVLVTDPHEISEALDGLEDGTNGKDDNDFYFITTRTPDNRAIDSLFDRALGKPKQSLDLGGTVKIKPEPILSKLPKPDGLPKHNSNGKG